MRWTVHGIPRVPWKAEGIFDGVSTFKLDRQGKIYEHQVRDRGSSWPHMQCLGSLCTHGLHLLMLVFQEHHQACVASNVMCLNIVFNAEQVDNVILRDPPMLRSPLFAGLNLTPLLQPQPQTQPCPGAWCNNATSTPLAAEALESQPQASTLHQELERGNREAGGSVLRGVRGILNRDAAYLRQALSDRGVQREVASLVHQEQFPQPPCQI